MLMNIYVLSKYVKNFYDGYIVKIEVELRLEAIRN